MSLSVDEKMEIAEVLNRAAYGYDERDLEMIRACYHPAASMSIQIAGGDLMGPFEGRDTVMKLFTDSMAAQNDVRRHDVSNLFFLQSDEEIKAVSNLTLFATEEGQTKLLTTGVYRDTMVVHDGRWVIMHRHLDLDSGY